jgi:hypothetical protein
MKGTTLEIRRRMAKNYEKVLRELAKVDKALTEKGSRRAPDKSPPVSAKR